MDDLQAQGISTWIWRVVICFLLLGSIPACGRIGDRGLARIQSAGVLRVAIDPSFAPFAYVDEAGTLVGYDVDLARALAEQLEVEAHFVTTGYDALYDALTVGRADVIISALYPDLSRTHAFTYSRPYFNAGDVLVVPPDRDIDALEDLVGGKVVCRFGTTGHMVALTWQETWTPPPEVVPIEDSEAGGAILMAGDADALVIDHVTALGLVVAHPPLRIVDPPVTDEPYVIAARDEDQALIDALNQALAALEADGTLAALESRWMASR